MYNGVEFYDMKLAGVLVICVGFSLVLFPPNWADMLEPAIRYGYRMYVDILTLKEFDVNLACSYGPF